MDRDRIIGTGKQMVGSVKEAVGKLVGDAKMQAEWVTGHGPAVSYRLPVASLVRRR